MLLLQVIKILEMTSAVKLKKKIDGAQPAKSCPIPASQQSQSSRITLRLHAFHTAVVSASESRHAEWESHTERARKNAPGACLFLITCLSAKMLRREGHLEAARARPHGAEAGHEDGPTRAGASQRI